MSSFNNYQLYRTNILLGGQMKWDLVLEKGPTALYVSDFQLTPISNSVKFNTNKNITINNTHQLNIKEYYDSNSLIFYDNGLEPQFNSYEPVVKTDNEDVKLYSNICDMGCRRSPVYRRYNKQYEFFCPLWLEQLLPNEYLSFDITIKNAATNSKLTTKTFKLSADDLGTEYHNKFINYFNNYIDALGINTGCDDVLNIEFKSPKNAYLGKTEVAGVDVSNGMIYDLGVKPVSFDVREFIDSITTIERPLLDFDHSLTTILMRNKMVCKQLFNFNLCFNLEDILPMHLVQMMIGMSFGVNVDVYINGLNGSKLLSKVDFYTNYDHIDKISFVPNVDANVLDYLNDTNYIDNIKTNKFEQSICHWCLNDNSDYIFNVYEGFSGILSSENGSLITNNHYYGVTPNISSFNNDKKSNPTGWLNIVEPKSWNSFYKYIKNTDKYKLDGSLINLNTGFINGIKYKSYKTIPESINILQNKYLLGMVVDDNLLAKIVSRVDAFEPIYDNNVMYIAHINDLIIIITNNIKYLVFRYFKDIILWKYINTSASNNNALMKGLNSVLNSVINPECVMFKNFLKQKHVDGPLNKIGKIDSRQNEIAYDVKYNTVSNYDNIHKAKYVFRYDGRIKPSFTDCSNPLYYKDYITPQLSQNTNIYNYTPYGKYSNTLYEMQYPSIGYCGIKKLDSWDYDNLPYITVTGDYGDNHNEETMIYDNCKEYTWFNNNNLIQLLPTLYLSNIVNANNDNTTIDNAIHNLLTSRYNISAELATYVKKLYNSQITWEYTDEGYSYNVKLTLK